MVTTGRPPPYAAWLLASIGPPVFIFMVLVLLIFVKPRKLIAALPSLVPGLTIKLKRDFVANEEDHEAQKNVVVEMHFRGKTVVHPQLNRLLLCFVAPLFFVLMNLWDCTFINRVATYNYPEVLACTTNCYYTIADVKSEDFTPLSIDFLPLQCSGKIDFHNEHRPDGATFYMCFGYIFSIRLFFQSMAICTAQMAFFCVIIVHLSAPATNWEKTSGTRYPHLPASFCIVTSIFILCINCNWYGWRIETLETFLFGPCVCIFAASLFEAKRAAREWLCRLLVNQVQGEHYTTISREAFLSDEEKGDASPIALMRLINEDMRRQSKDPPDNVTRVGTEMSLISSLEQPPTPLEVQRRRLQKMKTEELLGEIPTAQGSQVELPIDSVRRPSLSKTEELSDSAATDPINKERPSVQARRLDGRLTHLEKQVAQLLSNSVLNSGVPPSSL